MTDFNKYNPYPNKFVIRCPKCHRRAIFQFPFSGPYFSESNATQIASSHPGSQIKECWQNKIKNQTYVVEYHPSLFPWQPKSNTFSFDLYWGVCSCLTCKSRFKHFLSWPEDAYYICTIRDELLWAWTAEHVETLIAYIADKQRDILQYKYPLFLRHLPKKILLAKNRDLVLKKLKKLLAEDKNVG